MPDLLDRIDFSDITVLDAGTGAGKTTLKLARKMAEVDSKGKITSVDINPETFQDGKKKLGELARFVEFVEADLTCMPKMESESFDLIVCTATMCALNDRPLKAVKALSEYYRILKKGGCLIIDDEYPVVGFREIESQKFKGGPLSKEAMNEWKEIMPEMINKIGDEDLRTAFQKATERIWRMYKRQGGSFPSYYVIRMKK